MNPSMISAAVSMQAIQQKLDVIAHNVANMNTTGFKRREASFQDVLTSVYRQPAGARLPGRMTPQGYVQGWGAKLASVGLVMEQGNLLPTYRPYDLALEGEGLFEIRLSAPDENGGGGEVRWTRDGSFQLTYDPADPGMMVLATQEGYPVIGADGAPVRIPVNHTPRIDEAGRIFLTDDAHPEAEPVPFGQLRIVRALRPQALVNDGANLFRLPPGTAADGVLETVDLAAYDGADGRKIAVRQGYLEQSNVNLAAEMTELLTAQRAYQLNARAIASSDTMMGLANNLRA